MNSFNDNFKQLNSDLGNIIDSFFEKYNLLESPIKIYTHLDADGLSAGAILGKALYREDIPFQITVIKQLERENIENIALETNNADNLIIFSDFGSGQYHELQNKINVPFFILDHHIPQGISSKDQLEKIDEIYMETKEWHINPYFYGFDGSSEISGSGISYLFAKKMNEANIDLSTIALVGANGDIQNQGPNKSFIGLNAKILEDAKQQDLIEIVNDLNFSTLKPVNQALAYSTDIKLPGLSGDENKSLKFLKKLEVEVENSDDTIKTLMDLTQEEKQKITSGLVEYASLKLDIEPYEILEKLIVNRYLLKNEKKDSNLYDIGEFSNLLNACGRMNNASIGIATAMGNRNSIYQKAQKNLKEYRKSLMDAIRWLKEENKIKEKDYIQYYDGEDKISDNIVGTVASILIFDENEILKLNKPLFGYAKRKNEDAFKISARAHKSLVKRGVNLSEAIRKALKVSKLEALGGGHPPAAGTKVPTEKINLFLENINKVIGDQINNS
ncbi:MAG: DHH family phosphoesterase [Promethearchaeota archaeon]|nr:MAG: DHH family phosphoesterase [Candidatus Lokiarchaeota archaeon]